MKRKYLLVLALIVLMLAAVIPVSANRGDGELGVIYVESQGLYYDTFAPVQELPMSGRFQELVPGDDFSVTPYGPGDNGYVGGRWWVDVNGNDMMDDEDRYFLCPLLGPGRENP